MDVKILNKIQSVLSQAEFSTTQRRKLLHHKTNDKRDKTDLVIYIEELTEGLTYCVIDYEDELLKQKKAYDELLIKYGDSCVKTK